MHISRHKISAVYSIYLPVTAVILTWDNNGLSVVTSRTGDSVAFTSGFVLLKSFVSSLLVQTFSNINTIATCHSRVIIAQVLYEIPVIGT